MMWRNNGTTRRYCVMPLLVISLFLLRSLFGQNSDEESEISIVSELQPPRPKLVRPLLEAVCPGRVIQKKESIGSKWAPVDDHHSTQRACLRAPVSKESTLKWRED
jgi:hypothetical protein